MAGPKGKAAESLEPRPGAKELTMIRPPSRPHWSQIGLAALAAFVLLTGAGCPDKHIGRLCSIPSDGGVDGEPLTHASINPLALECPSRICIKPAQMANTSTTSLC